MVRDITVAPPLRRSRSPGHIACSSDSKSEIVLPAFKNGEVALVLDVDSDVLNDFDEVDELYLRKLMGIVEKFI